MNRHVIFGAGVGLLAALAIVGVIAVGGTPGQVRQVKMDERRVSDMQAIEGGITQYVANQIQLEGIAPAGATRSYLPSSLAALDTPSIGGLYFNDPETSQPYEYVPEQNANSYQLCATFATASYGSGAQLTAVDRLWQHPAGRHCFPLEVDVDSIVARYMTNRQNRTSPALNLKAVPSAGLAQ